MNHGFAEVSLFMYGCLSLVMVGNRKGSAWQALGLGKGKRWREEALLLPTSTFTKKHFLVLGKNHVRKKVFVHDSRAGFTDVWSCTSPSLLSSASFASLFLHFLTAIPHSFPVCLLFLPQDPLIVTGKHLCCTSSH